MLAKRFAYVCAGILCLALAYHLGASTAAAQRSGPVDVRIVGIDPLAYTLVEPLSVTVSNEPILVSCPDCAGQ